MVKKIGILFFALLLLAIPAAGWAGELKLIKGKGVEMCEAYQQSLKSMSLQDMVCGEKDDTDNIKRPKWEKLDLRENKELVKKTLKFLTHGGDQFAKDTDIDDEKQFEKLMNEMYTQTDTLYKTHIDIDNDGKVEKILLYNEALCMETHVYSRPLLVLDEAKNQIDVKKTEPLMQNPFGKDLKTKAQDHFYQLYEIFFYKNKTYFDKWNTRDKTLNIYKQSKNATKEVCSYKYQQTKKQGGQNHED